MATGQTHLPKIKKPGKTSGESQGDSQLGHSQSRFNVEDDKVSPFKLPTDDEIFHYRENEKIRKLESKRNTYKLKIWDKKTASSCQPLRSFKDYGIMDANTSGTLEGKKRDKYASYGEREKLLITQAVDTIQERRKEREN